MRASTEDQFADRAKEMLEKFVQERGHKIASYYRENVSGTKLERPEKQGEEEAAEKQGEGEGGDIREGEGEGEVSEREEIVEREGI